MDAANFHQFVLVLYVYTRVHRTNVKGFDHNAPSPPDSTTWVSTSWAAP